MNRIQKALYELNALEGLAGQDRWVNRLYPSVKLAVTLLVLVLAVSFGKYDLPGLLGLFVYPLFMFIAGEIRFADALKRVGLVFPLLLIAGIANPFFDRQELFRAGSVAVTGGMVSMATLFLKGVLCVLSAYILVATTSITGICRALRAAGIPKSIVTVILLIYRYLAVLLEEADRVTSAYALRAPSEKGIAIRAWGSLAGSLLIRSMDRAQALYESMLIRGFSGDFRAYPGQNTVRKGNRTASVLFLIIWIVILMTLRFYPLAEILGTMMRGGYAG